MSVLPASAVRNERVKLARTDPFTRLPMRCVTSLRPPSCSSGQTPGHPRSHYEKQLNASPFSEELTRIAISDVRVLRVRCAIAVDPNNNRIGAEHSYTSLRKT